MIFGNKEYQNCIDEIRKKIERYSVLYIVGEEGVGKETIMEFLHYESSNRNKKILKVNGYAGSAINVIENLEYHLQESIGTIYLQNIEQIPDYYQKELCKKISYIINETGYEGPKIISATADTGFSKLKLVKELACVLEPVKVNVPPLRFQKEALIDYAKYFLYEIAGAPVEIEKNCCSKLLAYKYPGNLRELKDIMKTAYEFSDKKIIKEVYIHKS